MLFLTNFNYELCLKMPPEYDQVIILWIIHEDAGHDQQSLVNRIW